MGTLPGHERRVLAVVPTLDADSERLRRLLDTVRYQECRAPLHVLIVANRGSEPPIEVVGRRVPEPPPGVSLVETGLNLGFAGSINFAATLEPFAWIWLLQDDLVLDPGCLRELLTAMDEDPSLGAVNPTRLTADGLVRRGHAGGMLDAEGNVEALLPRETIPLADYVPDASPDFLMSRGMLIRAEAWHQVGGMDARFYPVGWSDVDLCTRLRDAGWSIATIARATLTHEKGASTPSVLGAETFERNGRLHRAKRAGASERPAVHPAIPREALEIVAQAASALMLHLAADPIGLPERPRSSFPARLGARIRAAVQRGRSRYGGVRREQG